MTMALVPSYIQQLANYRPGKPISEAQRELGIQDFIKLASNENPLGPSPKGLAAIQDSLNNLHRYPDATGYELRTKLAKRFNIKMENVVLGAGSEGIMSTIMRTFLLSDDELISAANSFIGFRVLANASGRHVNWVPMKNYRYDLEAMADKITDYTKIIYIANPDNPMGTTITRQEFDEFYTHIPERVLIILDEAYYEFAQDSPNYPDSMSYRYDNVITLRTYSKAYGLAGARIGYGFAHESLIGNLMKVKVPFEPSLTAQAAGMAALDDEVFLAETLAVNEKGIVFLKQEFDALGIENVPSGANFITTVWESEDRASNLTQSLLEKGVIVRQLTGFGWPNCIRISVGLEAENQKCIESLKEIL
tara:strand:+ start:535 stop:1626 length:1092 start_codon:yes stop_codon:yes gene_type:complete